MAIESDRLFSNYDLTISSQKSTSQKAGVRLHGTVMGKIASLFGKAFLLEPSAKKNPTYININSLRKFLGRNVQEHLKEKIQNLSEEQLRTIVQTLKNESFQPGNVRQLVSQIVNNTLFPKDGKKSTNKPLEQTNQYQDVPLKQERLNIKKKAQKPLPRPRSSGEDSSVQRISQKILTEKTPNISTESSSVKAKQVGSKQEREKLESKALEETSGGSRIKVKTPSELDFSKKMTEGYEDLVTEEKGRSEEVAFSTQNIIGEKHLSDSSWKELFDRFDRAVLWGFDAGKYQRLASGVSFVKDYVPILLETLDQREKVSSAVVKDLEKELDGLFSLLKNVVSCFEQINENSDSFKQNDEMAHESFKKSWDDSVKFLQENFHDFYFTRCASLFGKESESKVAGRSQEERNFRTIFCNGIKIIVSSLPISIHGQANFLVNFQNCFMMLAQLNLLYRKQLLSHDPQKISEDTEKKAEETRIQKFFEQAQKIVEPLFGVPGRAIYLK